MLSIESTKNLPTIVALIAVVILIATLPMYKESLKDLNHNVAGLLLGFICVVMFFLIDPKVAVLLLFVLLVFYYTSIKEENLSYFKKNINNKADVNDNFQSNFSLTFPQDAAISLKPAASLINTRVNDAVATKMDNLKKEIRTIDNNIGKIQSEINSISPFQNTQERISEGFFRDKVPEVYRSHSNTLNLNKETFKNHLQNNNIQELPSQNTTYNVNQKDVSGCRYDGKKMLQGEFEEYHGKPVADCSNYSKEGVETTGTAFYPLNR